MPPQTFLSEPLNFQLLLEALHRTLLKMCEIRITVCRTCGTLIHHYQMACPLVHIPKSSSQDNHAWDTKRTCGALTKKKDESAVPCRECLDLSGLRAIRSKSEETGDAKESARGRRDREWVRRVKEKRDRLMRHILQTWREKINERKKGKRSREEIEFDLKARIRFVQSSNPDSQVNASPQNDLETEEGAVRRNSRSLPSLENQSPSPDQDDPTPTNVPDWQDLEAAALSRYESAEHNIPMWQDPRNSIISRPSSRLSFQSVMSAPAGPSYPTSRPQSPDPWSQGTVPHRTVGASRAQSAKPDVEESLEPLHRWKTTTAVPPPRRYSRALEGLEQPHPPILSILNHPTAFNDTTRPESPCHAPLSPSPLFTLSSSPYRPSSPFSITEGMATSKLLSRLTIIEEARASREALREIDEALKILEADESPPIPPKNPARMRRHSAV